MKVTYSWLKSLVDFDYSPDELVEVLTMLGLEVDSIDNKVWNFDGMVVGQVTNKIAHRNSDKLWICEVNIGDRHLSVVCGAPNVEVGQKVAVAPENSRLPDGTMIRKARIRGVESEGMICSELELGISSRGDEIMVLDDKVEQGRKLQEVLGKGEVIIDIDVTPNRPDCFGVIGIAREIAAVSGTALNKPNPAVREDSSDIHDLISINILDQDKCPRYSARFIGGVEIKPSPWWLAQRLEAVGIRSINNVVDVTNYVMMETGQPLHAFDYALLKGEEINVRTASEGQGFTTLDDRSHSLSSECLMICDSERLVAIGGIMGGLNSEVSDKTRDILLESAYFDPVNIRRTSKYLGVSTESSKRFERGTDPNGTLYALDRAAQLMSELANGTVAKGQVDVYPTPIKPKKVRLRMHRVELLLGKNIPLQQTRTILSKLGLKVEEKSNQEFDVKIPTFRPDLTREADLVEEIARVYGYDNIERNTLAVIQQLRPKNLVEDTLRKVESYLISSGASQVVTYCMISKADAEMFSGGRALIRLTNPISEDLSHLRPSLIPGLLNAMRWNINRRNASLSFFEIGTVFQKAEDRIVENQQLTAALTGHAIENSWKAESKNYDIYDIKGLASSLLDRNSGASWRFRTYSTSFTNNKTLSLEIDNQFLGFIGEVDRRVLERFEIQQPVFVLDLDFSKFLDAITTQRQFSPIPKFPPISRDIAVVVTDDTESEAVWREIRQNGGEDLMKVELFDVFASEQIGKGLKSLAYNLTFYSLRRTLTDQEVDLQIKAILDSLASKFGARLRD